MAKAWTREELDYLEDKWGLVSIDTISKKIGRSIDAVKLKAHRIGLGDSKLQYDGITLHQLSKALNVSYSLIKGWKKKYELPVKTKVFAESMRVYVVKYDDFWQWAESNKQMIDFARVEENILGLEPDWVKEKRDADFIKARRIKKTSYHAWTEEEDNILKGMLKAYKYTYPEISQRLNRSEGAIKRRCLDLGLRERPIRLKQVHYTQAEVDLIVSLFDKGHCLEDIASRINKSALGVRGKLERMGYKFKNGVPVKTQS